MTRYYRPLALSLVVAALGGCGSSTTAPKNNTSTTTYYAGLFASPAASGSATAKLVSSVSGELVAGNERAGLGPSGSAVGPLGGGGSTITITMTLLNNTVLTLTGTVNGTSFSVTDNLGDMCTGTVANLLNATCTVAFDPTGPISLLMLLQGGPVDIAGGLNIYCGFETPPASQTPDASVVLGIWGLNSATMTTLVDTSFIARVATLDNSLSFFLDATATYNNVADTLVGSNADYFTGMLTGSGLTATWNGTEMNSGVVGNWNAGPCTLVPAGLGAGSTVTFTAPVNTLPTPASQTVTVSPAGAGPVTAAVPASAATWLKATTSGEVVTLTITGTQGSAGSENAAVSVWPQFAQNAPLMINVTYNATGGASPLAITTASLPAGTENSVYTATTLAATGGTTPYTWSATGLPTGLVLGPSTGVLSGTPTVNGSFSVVVTATDATKPTAQTATKTYTLAIASASSLAITTAALPAGTENSVYAATTLTATGGTTPYTWSATGLPTNLVLSPSGVLSGTPTVNGSFTVAVTVTDATKPTALTATKSYTLAISAPLTITTTSPLPGGQTGILYAPMGVGVGEQFAASGGTAPYTWAITTPATEPPGLSMNSSGLFSGRPTAFGTYTFTVLVTDAASNTKSGQFMITIAPGPLVITTSSPLPGGAQGTPYDPPGVQFAAQGGVPSYSWSITSAPATIPPGLSLGASGLLSGTPTSAGSYTFTVQVADAAKPTANTYSAAFSVTIAPPANTAALWLGNADDQLLYYTSVGLTTSNTAPSSRTSSPAATGVSYLAVDYSGNLWMSSASKGTVAELPVANFNSGTTTTTISLPAQPFAGATATTQPAGIVFGPAVPAGFYPDSGLWVTDSANPAIYHYTLKELTSPTPTTNDVLWVNSVLVTYGSGSAPIGATKFAGLAFDAVGRMWVLDQKQSRLLEVLNGQLPGSGATQVIEGFIGTSRTLQPQSLAFDASGNLWISFLSQGTIYEYTRAQLNAINQAEPVPYAQLSVTGVADSITSIAFDQSGNLWLVEAANANTSTAMAMISNAHLVAAGGTYSVSPDLTWTQSGLPTSIAWDPAPSNLPLGNVLRPTPAPSASRITATSIRKP